MRASPLHIAQPAATAISSKSSKLIFETGEPVGVDAMRSDKSETEPPAVQMAAVESDREEAALAGSAMRQSRGPLRSLPSGSIRAFILDDHDVVRTGLGELLRDFAGVKVVGEARTVAEAMTRIPSTRPDVAVLDVRLPDGSGVEVCRAMRSSIPGLRCLMLTSYEDDDAMVEAVIAGASGYVLKHARALAVVDAVIRVAAGESLIDPTVMSKLVGQVRAQTATDPRLLGLSAREQEILRLITEGLTNREIGDRLHLAEQTVKHNVTALLSRLNVQRRAQAAVFGARASLA